MRLTASRIRWHCVTGATEGGASAVLPPALIMMGHTAHVTDNQLQTRLDRSLAVRTGLAYKIVDYLRFQ